MTKIAQRDEIPESSILYEPSGNSLALLIHTSRDNIVIFQALFESYEGIGTVRTMDAEKSILSIITTSSMLDIVLDILFSRTSDNSFPTWRFYEHITPAENLKYFEF